VRITCNSFYSLEPAGFAVAVQAAAGLERPSSWAAVTLMLLLACGLTSLASAQSIAQDAVIDGNFPLGEPLEKEIDYFLSPEFPSVIIGNARGGLYLYRSQSNSPQGRWGPTTITPKGSAYERVRSIKFAGDLRPNVVASNGNQIIWFENPRNHSKKSDLTRPWVRHVINPDHGCRDIRVEDLDGDGKVDGVTWYEQPDDPQSPWVVHSVAASYRDVHEINIGEWSDGSRALARRSPDGGRKPWCVRSGQSHPCQAHPAGLCGKMTLPAKGCRNRSRRSAA